MEAKGHPCVPVELQTMKLRRGWPFVSSLVTHGWSSACGTRRGTKKRGAAGETAAQRVMYDKDLVHGRGAHQSS